MAGDGQMAGDEQIHKVPYGITYDLSQTQQVSRGSRNWSSDLISALFPFLFLAFSSIYSF